jgi:hypothetical protein
MREYPSGRLSGFLATAASSTTDYPALSTLMLQEIDREFSFTAWAVQSLVAYWSPLILLGFLEGWLGFRTLFMPKSVAIYFSL